MPTDEKKRRGNSEEKSHGKELALGTLAALAGGGLAYKLSRRPNFSPTNKSLSALQRRAAEKGFHRIVDVTPRANAGDLSWKDRLEGFLRPTADKDGRLGAMQRLKMWLLEGGEAIPVMGKDGKVYRVTPEGLSRKALNVDGVVHGRRHLVWDGGNDASKLIRGGMDLEGPMATQRAATALGKGKHLEALLLNKHAPGAMAETLVGLPALRGRRVEERLRGLQAALEKKFKGKDYLLKHPDGVASSGKFPMGDADWADLYSQYRTHLSDPKNRAAFQAAQKLNKNALSEYLKSNNIHEGHVLDNLLKGGRGGDLSEYIAQRRVPGVVGEWRVHSQAGEVPTGMMAPRFARNIGQRLSDITGTKRREMQAFVQSAVNKLPQKYRQGTYGIDVLEYVGADGKPQYKIVEMNPTSLADLKNGVPSGRSGFLESHTNPGVGHEQYELATGRKSTPIALRNAALAAAGAGAATYGGARLLRDNEDEA